MHSEMISRKSVFALHLGTTEVERHIDCLIWHCQNSNSAVSGVWIKSLFFIYINYGGSSLHLFFHLHSYTVTQVVSSF